MKASRLTGQKEMRWFVIESEERVKLSPSFVKAANIG